MIGNSMDSKIVLTDNKIGNFILRNFWKIFLENFEELYNIWFDI